MNSNIFRIIDKIMKAVRIQKFGPPENLQIENVPIPTPSKGEILINVKASGINPVDTYIREGTYATLPNLPAILGYEVSGLVEDVGPSVTKYKKGDRVFGGYPTQGGYSEYALCKENCVFPLHEKLSFSQGAGLFIPYFTAYRALVTKCKIKPNEIVLIHGASGAVGLAAIQIAKAHGLVVAGTAGSIEGQEVVSKTGADHVFNHKDKGYLNNAVAAIGGHGFDVVLENLANVNLGADLTVLNQNARVAVVGSRGTVEMNPRNLMYTESQIIGVKLFSMSESDMLETADYVLNGIEKGWLNPIVAKEYTLEEASQAHHDIIYNKGAVGKVVFKL